MKSVTYIGGCATIQEFGVKFTLHRKTVTLSDENASPFINHPTYRVMDVPDVAKTNTDGGQEGSGEGNNEGSGENNDSNDKDAMKKKLMRLTAEQLQQMCESKGLDTEGSKEVLVDRIIEVQE